MESITSNPVVQQSPAHPSESTPGGDGAASIEPGAGRASGLRDAGALTGFTPPKQITVRDPRADDPTACRVGGCLEPVTTVLVFPGLVGEWKDALCGRHAQDLLMTLAEKLGVGRRDLVTASPEAIEAGLSFTREALKASQVKG